MQIEQFRSWFIRRLFAANVPRRSVTTAELHMYTYVGYGSGEKMAGVREHPRVGGLLDREQSTWTMENESLLIGIPCFSFNNR